MIAGLLILSSLLNVAVADSSCPPWPDLGPRFLLRRSWLNAWHKPVFILQGAAVDNPDNDQARFVLDKQCGSFRTDLDFREANTKEGDGRRFAATDAKHAFCGAKILVKDCTDAGDPLFTIMSDDCFVQDYDIHRGDEKGPVVYKVVRDGSILSRFHNLTVPLAGGEAVFATAEQQLRSPVFQNHVITVNATVALALTEQQRLEAAGLFAMIIATRMLDLDENGDGCTAFQIYGIPLLVLCSLLCVCVLVKALVTRLKK